ncbi:MAG: hypothetical protein IT317_16555 [Anaerolineales bacterium]|nr:hypothetical protein [Anaerolineales bacterium]
MRRAGRLALALLLAACQSAAPSPPTVPTATPPPVSVPAATATAPPATPTIERASPTVAPAPATPTPLAAASSPLSRPAYALTATVDTVAHTIAVTAVVTFVPPDSAQAFFNFNPLQAAALAQPLTVQVNGRPATPALDGVWVSVPFPAGLPPDAPVRVAFTYALRLAAVNPNAWGWRGTLGWTDRQLNLGDWYPALAPYTAAGWLTPPPTALGEYAATPYSDFTVRIAAAGLDAAPFVLGSGSPQPCAPDWCFILTGGRFVAYVVSSVMQTATVQTTTGVTVTSVYLPEHAAAAQAALRAAAAALETYTDLFGPYPFSQFVQVEGDFYDGMEYSGLSYVGAGYYAEYDGTPRNLLTLISAHEVAHQWWYNQVGNDQAHAPWLDEALCTYAEPLFLARRYPEAVDWWWRFRVDAYAPRGAVDSTIYDHGDFRGYVDAVYLRGAQMLRAMHTALGDARFVAFLRAYAAAQAGQLATAADFWAAYAAAGGDPAAVQAAYFAAP